MYNDRLILDYLPKTNNDLKGGFRFGTMEFIVVVYVGCSINLK